MSTNVWAYARVSVADQNLSRQLVAFREANIPEENIFADKQSGKDFDRPAYKALLAALEPGDTLYILSIDRLGRNYEEIQTQWRVITKEIGADIVVIDMSLLDTRRAKDLLGTFIADLILQLLSFCAENERSSTRARQAAGIAAAQAKGVKFGRPPIQPPQEFAALLKRWERKEITLAGVLKPCNGASESTFYRWRRELKAKQSHRKQ